MPGPSTSLSQHVRDLLGRARLVYWSAADLSARLNAIQTRLDGPLGVQVAGPAERREALAALVEVLSVPSLHVVAEGDAEVLLLDPAVVASPPDRLVPEARVAVRDAGAPRSDAPLPGFRQVVAVDLDRAGRAATLTDEALQGTGAPGPEFAGRIAALAADGVVAPAAVRRALVDETDTAELAEALEGLAADAETLRALGCLSNLQLLLHQQPRPGTELLAAEADSLVAFTPEARELAARVWLRAPGPDGLGPAETARAVAVLDAARALDTGGLVPRPPDLEAELRHWRELAQDRTRPSGPRAAAQTIARACERLLAHDPRTR